MGTLLAKRRGCTGPTAERAGKSAGVGVVEVTCNVLIGIRVSLRLLGDLEAGFVSNCEGYPQRVPVAGSRYVDALQNAELSDPRKDIPRRSVLGPDATG